MVVFVPFDASRCPLCSTSPCQIHRTMHRIKKLAGKGSRLLLIKRAHKLVKVAVGYYTPEERAYLVLLLTDSGVYTHTNGKIVRVEEKFLSLLTNDEVAEVAVAYAQAFPEQMPETHTIPYPTGW